MGRILDVQEADIRNLKIAAWFHDIGHIETWEGHEEVSAKYAQEYLRKH